MGRDGVGWQFAVAVALALLPAGCRGEEGLPAAGTESQPAASGQQARLMAGIAGFGALAGERDDPRVVEAMQSVPRAEFVLPEWRGAAEDDRALPIAHGQTISQPTIVALMTQLLRTEPGHRVLEVGTGSGYQAAVLSPLVAEIYTVEIVPELAKSAAATLERLGYGNVRVRAGDGYRGWPEEAPFDGIIVTAGAPRVPEPLVEQLRPGGRMVIPVGPSGGVQTLTVIEKDADGRARTSRVIEVRFVPLTGEGGSARRR
ncbi:MAG: protein-L-isoaspartate(D-aspartate) O-methyltransferase [Thermaurantiacus sp.]